MADEKPTIRSALSLTPSDASRAFRARDELAISVSWRDMRPEEHARAFTVAKVAKLDLLTTIRESLDQALASGQSFEQWRTEVLPHLQKAGWWGLVQDRSLTGTDDPVFVGEQRLRTIFRTNMRVSHAAGQWARIQSAKAKRPYLRYVAVQDDRTRPEHRRWHGIVLPVDHPFWATHFPPNGWNCRCQVQQLDGHDLERFGYSVTTEDELARIVSMDPIGNAWIGRRGADGGRPRRDVLRGVDPGWDYNVGQESMIGVVEKAAASIARARAAGLEDAAAAIMAEIAKLLPDDLVELLAQLLGGIAAGHERWADTVIPAARRKRGKKGAAAIRARGYAHGGRPDQKRDAGGRFAPENAMGEKGYRKLAESEKRRFLVMGELPQARMSQIGARSNTILMSGETAAKQRRHHPELTASDYNRVSEIAAHGEWRLDRTSLSVLHVTQEGDHWHMAMKVTRSGEPILLSIRRSTPSDHDRIRRRSEKM